MDILSDTQKKQADEVIAIPTLSSDYKTFLEVNPEKYFPSFEVKILLYLWVHKKATKLMLDMDNSFNYFIKYYFSPRLYAISFFPFIYKDNEIGLLISHPSVQC